MATYLRDPKTGLPLRHPRTGQIIVPDGYTRRGVPIWPMFGAEDNPPADPPADPPQDPPSGSPTFTQAQLNAITKRETGKAGEAATRKLLETLGVGSVDDLKALMKAQQDAADKDKTDTEKAREAAAKAQRDAEVAKTEAATERFRAQAERALLRAGLIVPEGETEKAEKALNRAIGLLIVEPGADPDDIKADVKELIELYPALFRSEEDPKNPPTHTTPGKAPKKTPPVGGLARGMQRAQSEAAGVDAVRAKMYPGTVPAGTTT